jgi:hypothetical protein
MTKILDIPNGNYKIAVTPGGTITLNTGVDVGTVIITGDLLVQGEQTTLNTTDLDVEDRIVRLNYGETGQGVTPGTGIQQWSGLQIVRGSLPDALMVWDESAPYEDDVTGTQGLGAFSFKIVDSNGTASIAGIQTNSIDSGGGALQFDAGNNPLRAAAADYENYVVDDDDIPNSKWVIDYVTTFSGANPPTVVQQGDTLLAVEDFDNTGVDSIIRLQVDGFNRLTVTTTTAIMYDLKFENSTISSVNSGDDLVLQGTGGGNVRIPDGLHLDENGPGAPTNPTTGTILFHDQSDVKDTGIKYITPTKEGDLVSRRTAALFALIF